MQVFNRQGATLGTATEITSTLPGTSWNIQVHLLSGFGRPVLCRVGKFTSN
jgi:hypothetical protein